jgi:osmotically-inducible protein OsmY
MKKSDDDLQHDVMAELEAEPSVDHADIGVSVHDGVVTLSGFVKSYAEKLCAEKAARRVSGLRALAEEIIVRFAEDPRTADYEIAQRIVDMFTWNVLVPDEAIKVKVEHGLVTLTGEVDWAYQRDEARKVAGKVIGVKSINNLIVQRRHVSAFGVKQRIVEAIRRRADEDASAIVVEAEGEKIVLRGRVKSWSDRKIAEETARAAPGVTGVIDEIVVG